MSEPTETWAAPLTEYGVETTQLAARAFFCALRPKSVWLRVISDDAVRTAREAFTDDVDFDSALRAALAAALPEILKAELLNGVYD